MEPKFKVNVWGGISIKEKFSIHFFTENMNSELYINILKEKLPKVKKVVHKGFILVRDNAPERASETTQHFIKEKKVNELKILSALCQDLNPI